MIKVLQLAEIAILEAIEIAEITFEELSVREVPVRVGHASG